MRIAVDAAGGDHGPAVGVVGAVAGARRFGVDLLLTGAEAEIRSALVGQDVTGIDVVVADAPETIGGDEQAAQAVRRKPRSAIAVALDAVRDGRADAMVSAGNSGAVMAGALLKLGRIRGVDRPAIAGHLPSMTGRTLVLDMGAVTDPRPQHLVQFAQMGSIYTEQALGVARPKVGLLSNGEEPSKGNQLVQETFPLLASARRTDSRRKGAGNDVCPGAGAASVAARLTAHVALTLASANNRFINPKL